MSQMKEQEMAKEKESGSKPPLTPEESERLNQSVQKSEAQAAAQLRHQRKVRILIPSGRGEHEKGPVTLGVNGQSYLIERDKEVEVPEAVVHALELAVEKQPLVNVDPVTRERTMSFVPVPRFPYRRIGEAV